MKHHLSCLKGDTIKAIILVCLAVGVVGMSYGSLAMAYGFPVWVPFVLSITVLAGAQNLCLSALWPAAVIRWRLRLPDYWSTRAMCRLA
jgi:predicted branched-subunit amino acid permease